MFDTFGNETICLSKLSILTIEEENYVVGHMTKKSIVSRNKSANIFFAYTVGLIREVLQFFHGETSHDRQRPLQINNLTIKEVRYCDGFTDQKSLRTQTHDHLAIFFA